MTAKTTLIGLHGKAQSGKDTAAGILAEWGWTRIAFGDQLKKDLLILDPLIGSSRLADLVDVVGWEEAKHDAEVRRLLQVYGTDVARNGWGQDCWIQRALPAVTHRSKTVFSDVRFDNEAAFIVNSGGVVLHITRPDAGLPGTLSNHVSEAGIHESLIHMTIRNDGSIEDLACQLRGRFGPPVVAPKQPKPPRAVKPPKEKAPKPPRAVKERKPRPPKPPKEQEKPVPSFCENCHKLMSHHAMGERRACQRELLDAAG